MYKNLRWKLLSIVAVAAVAIVAFSPPSKKINLGLDLKGGVHLVLRVQTDDALRVQTDTTTEQLREALAKVGVTVGKIAATSVTSFQVEGVPSDKDKEFRQAADEQTNAAYDRAGGTGVGNYTFTMKPNIEKNWRDDSVTQEIQTIDRRVNELGVSEPIVAPYGSSGDKIVVQLPGVGDVERAEEIIGKTAMLE